jgi:hypothetical protein
MSFCLSAQSKTNEINIGIGQSKYKHSYAMPAGASGVRYGLDFWHTKQLKSNSEVSFGYFAELTFSSFNTWKNYNYMFYDGGMDVGVFWLRDLPLGDTKINLSAGGGLFFDTYLFLNQYSSDSKDIATEMGQWHISPNICLAGDYAWKKLDFHLRFSMPIVSAGFQSRSLFYSTAWDNIKLILTPNVVYFFTKRFYPQADLSCSYPIINTKNGECRLQLKYAIDELFFNGYPSERKEVHELKLGILWMIK